VRLVAIDVSEAMLDIARQRAQTLGRAVYFQVGDATALPFPDERFDSVVCTLSLCCVPDDRRAVAEMKRVLRSGGLLLLLDHVASDVYLVRIVQRMLEPFWSRWHADSLLRHPLEHVQAEGFEVVCHERSKWGIV